MKRGFTLIELLAVIVLLGLISILTAPAIINQLAKSKDESSTVMNEIIHSAADLYLDNHQDGYPKNTNDYYCVQLKTLINEGFLTEPIVDPLTSKEYDTSLFVGITVGNNEELEYNLSKTCTEIRN